MKTSFSKLSFICLLVVIISVIFSCNNELDPVVPESSVSVDENNIKTDDDFKVVMQAIQSDSFYNLANNILSSNSKKVVVESSPDSKIVSKRAVIDNASISDIFDDVEPLITKLKGFDDDLNADNSASFNCDLEYTNLNLDLMNLDKILDAEDYADFIKHFEEGNLPTDLSEYGLTINKFKAKVDLNVSQEVDSDGDQTKVRIDLNPSDFSLNFSIEPNDLINLYNSDSEVTPKCENSILNRIKLDTDNNMELDITEEFGEETEIFTGSASVSSDNIIEIELVESYEYNGTIKIVINSDYSIDDFSKFADIIDQIDDAEDEDTAEREALLSILQEGSEFEISIKAYSTNNVETYSKTFTSLEEFLEFIVEISK